MNTHCAGLIFDDSVHYIDHLAPFCAQMGWPLLVCDESIVELCHRFYPMTTVIPTNFSQLQLPPCVVSCSSKPALHLALGPLSTWNGRLIWLPHGWSDKGWKVPFFEALQGEDLLLTYGERMRQVLREKQIQISQVSIGNFRCQFYQTHSSFYKELMDKAVKPGEFFLYAPTWDDAEQNSNFWSVFESLVHAVPADAHLVIKTHPNTQKRFPAKLERCRGIADSLPNVSFLDDFPPIYPILERCKVYIGDMSSIGYDALYRGLPLFFLKASSTHLMQYGELVTQDELQTLFLRNSIPKKIPTEIFDDVDSGTIKQQITEWITAWE